MRKIKADFLQNATNVYRTKKFIVRQNIGILYHEKLDINQIFSVASVDRGLNATRFGFFQNF